MNNANQRFTATLAVDRSVRFTPLDRILRFFTLMRPGEGRSVVLFSLTAFLIMVAYYILKTLREPLLLATASAEIKSYAYATIALVLLVAIPLYGKLCVLGGRRQVTRWVYGFFVGTLLIFYLLGRSGLNIGFAYYVWVGIASLMLTAQFWGYAADTYNVVSGQRLFPVIMLGATVGGLVGPILASNLFSVLGSWNLMLLVVLLLAPTLLLVGPSRGAVPSGSRSRKVSEAPTPSHPMGGLAMVLRDPYLLLLAALVVLLNWVNTTGEYILAELVVRYADQQVASNSALSKSELIAVFYGNFYLAVNAVTVLIQLFLVARLFRWFGLRGSVLVLPALACIGYGLAAFVPVFTVIKVVKVLENSTDYSLMNTARHALYLPLSTQHKFEGKTAIETFFWRFGDLLQAGVIFAGLHWLHFGVKEFALMNLALSLCWLAVAHKLGSRYDTEAAKHTTDHPPSFTRPLGPVAIPSDNRIQIALPADCFTDTDPGDVLTVRAELTDGSSLPVWLCFDADNLAFSGVAPNGLNGTTEIELTAQDFEGKEACGRLVLVHRD